LVDAPGPEGEDVKTIDWIAPAYLVFAIVVIAAVCWLEMR
jgi:hypothetical protein